MKGPWGQGATGCSPAARGPGPLQLGPGHSRAVPGGGGDHLWAGHWPQPPPPAGWPGEDCAGHCTMPGAIPRLLGALVHSVGARLNGDPGLMGARLDGEQGWMGSQAGWGARLDGEPGSSNLMKGGQGGAGFSTLPSPPVAPPTGALCHRCRRCCNSRASTLASYRGPCHSHPPTSGLCTSCWLGPAQAVQLWTLEMAGCPYIPT